ATQHKGVEPDIEFPSMYAADKYGESSEPSALPWDQISATDFVPVADLKPLIGMLSEKHQARMEDSPAYRFLLEDIETMKKQETETSVTLSEEKLKKEREEARLKRKERTDALKKLEVNLPTGGTARPVDEGLDFIQEESLSVMADYVAQLTQLK